MHSNPPKKRLGQHFLKGSEHRPYSRGGGDGGRRRPRGRTGAGLLTTFLAEKARLVYAIELDPDVTAELRQVRGFDNVIVHEADALRFDYESLQPAPNKLVANLPYNVASPLVLRLLEEVQGLPLLRFMVQLEVARRMAASRGTKDYGAYAVLVQLLAEVEVAHRVSPNVFDPRRGYTPPSWR